MKKTLTIKLLSVATLTASLVAFTLPEEGMFPLSEVKKIDFKQAGFKIGQNELYNPNGVSLIDALVQVGGCTGSFVSNEGLIVTNHHCAFGAVQLASTPEKDYLTNGFVARARSEEIEAKGLTCRITESYEDVSDRVLGAVTASNNPADRMKKINEKIAEIVKEEEAKDKTIKAEVSEMFIGKTYVLFRYKTIQDVRLVYIPRRTVGEFGGESDNWVWPRHTGDFSFLRAYVAPDGSSAKYSKDNVPFKPKRFLKVNPGGVNEGDFVFILGYPGRTFRHRPAAFVENQQKFLLPYISSLFEWQNQQMIATGATNKADELRQATRIKSKANVLKNYKGKLKGLRALDLVTKKREEEKAMQQFIDADPTLKAKYGNLLANIEKLYKEMNADAQRELAFNQIVPGSNLLSIAGQINSFKQNLIGKTAEGRTQYYKESSPRLLSITNSMYDSYVPETDRRLLKRVLMDAASLPNNQRIEAVDRLVLKNKTDKVEKRVDDFVKTILNSTKLKKPEYLKNELKKTPDAFLKSKDALMMFANQLSKQADQLASVKQNRDGRLNMLMADYVEVKMMFKKTEFIPDANSTLRLTYGHIKSYWPADATYMRPQTTLAGLIEKGTDAGDYELPVSMRELYARKDFGRWKSDQLNDVPVAFLYDTDTSGGNSGSPVMNDKGELVGVNFDRAFEATINDYAWNESYSRSIGVDIRYVLWIAEKMDKADFILKELGVN